MDVERSGRDHITDVYVEPRGVQERFGALIPARTRYTTGDFVVTRVSRIRVGAMLAAFVLAAFAVGSFVGVQLMPGWTTVAATELPAVVVQYDQTGTQHELSVGPEPLLSQPNFFTETVAVLEAAETAFIEADLSAMKLRYHASGSVVFETDILSKGKEGSWWETPAGLYQVEYKTENHFSSFGQVYQPWSMVFQGNFFIHGWPEYEDGRPVPDGYSGGCIRLDTSAAAELFAMVPVGTPVVVFEQDFERDGYQYEPNVPELTADNYAVMDIKNNTILAGDNLDEVVPIASITKLMTALVAAEYINLDTTVSISPERYVNSLIPRLTWRNEASMYSLLQLLLVESSNEAAEVIASVIGREQFIEHMNDKANALGLHNTTFADPSGLDEENVSTPSDLIRLLQYVHNNRSFILTLTVDADLPTAYVSGEFGALTNFNVSEDIPNLIGGKVGETLAAGQTVAALHTFIAKGGEERSVAIVLLGSTDRTGDINRLYEYVTDRYGE